MEKKKYRVKSKEDLEVLAQGNKEFEGENNITFVRQMWDLCGTVLQDPIDIESGHLIRHKGWSWSPEWLEEDRPLTEIEQLAKKMKESV